MRARVWVTGLVAVVAAAGLAGCGNGDGDGGLRKLPVAGGFGGQAAGASAAMAKELAPVGGDAMLAPVRPVEYRLAEGAKAPATEAPAYRLEPDGDLDEARVRKALGVGDEGTVELHSGIGWSFQRDGDEAVSSSSGVAVACAPDQTCEDVTVPPRPPAPPGVPTPAAARSRAEAVLRGLGIDPDEGRIEVLSAEDDPYQRQVSFTPEVGGLAVSGLETYLSFGENGRVEGANGLVARFEKLGDYPLVDLAEAFRRSQEGFGGVGGGVRPMTADAGAATAAAGAPTEIAPGEPTEPPGEPTVTIEPQPTTPTVPLEPEIVEITGAELVLEPVGGRCEGDDVFLVPTFRLLPKDRFGFAVPAVAETSLDVPAAGADDEPAPCPEDTAGDQPVGKPEPATTVDAP